MPEVVARESVEVLENTDGWLTVVDAETGVASQGATLPEALRNLAEALELFHDEEKSLPKEELEVPDTPWFKD